MTCNNCDKPCKTCNDPCGCAEPIFSIEPMADDPTVIRFNVNGKSIWYDFESAIKAGETCTTLTIDSINRLLKYIGECGEQSITAQELGSIIHLGDLGDVNANTISDNGILNYRKDNVCPEGCESTGDGWVSTNPIDVSGNNLSYVLGTDSDGKMTSLMPPSDTTTFSYLAWAAQDKAKWVKPRQISAVSDNYAPLYLDKTTGEIVVLQGDEQNE